MQQSQLSPHEREPFSIRYEVLNGEILHIRASGYMEESHVKPLMMQRHSVATPLIASGKCNFVLVDLTDATGSSLKAIRSYLKLTRKYYSDLQRPPTHIVYGTYPLLKPLIGFAKTFMPFRVLISRDYPSALELMNMEKKQKKEGDDLPSTQPLQERTEPADQIQRYATELLAYLDNINWEGVGYYGPVPEIPAAHPFKLVFETINLIKTATELHLEERRQIEGELQESEEKFKSLSQNTPDIIYTLDTTGTFTYINPAWENTLGHKRKDVVGKPLWDFTDEETGQQARHFVHSINNNETIRDRLLVLINKSGASHLFNMSGAPNFSSNGQLIGIVGTLKDITEQRRLEAQFQQAQKMEAIGTLAGGIAHDFNNLMMGIQGYVSLMLIDKEPNHPDYERLKNIEKQVKSAAHLTNQLLGFARGGKYQVRPSDLNELIGRSAAMFGRTKKEITIHEAYQKDLWPAEIDERQVEQVLLNLYINAWQAMPGGGDLYLSTQNHVLDEYYTQPYQIHAGNYIKTSITDTGIGMDEKVRKRIFEPFFTTKEMGRGTGLGLASAYGIIKGHGGFINVYSELGFGTTFNIYLPASDKSKFTGQPLIEEQTLRGSETILVIDDENMILMITRDILESLGYTVLTAENGQKALDLYEKRGNDIDLVILDMIMPGMGGQEVFEDLQKLNPDIKVVLSSGYSLNSDAARIMEKGCKAFIQKPFTLTQFSQQVRRTLDESSTAHPDRHVQ